MPEEKNLCVRPSAVGPFRGGGLLKRPPMLYFAGASLKLPARSRPLLVKT